MQSSDILVSLQHSNIYVKYLLEPLFWIIGVIMCYLTTIIFYLNPQLFNLLGKTIENGNKNDLIIGILFLPVVIIYVGSRNSISNSISCRKYIIYTLILYSMTIVISNILSLIIFKYITTTLYVLFAPLFGFMISLLAIIMFEFFRWLVKLLLIYPINNKL